LTAGEVSETCSVAKLLGKSRLLLGCHNGKRSECQTGGMPNAFSGGMPKGGMPTATAQFRAECRNRRDQKWKRDRGKNSSDY